MGCVTPAMEVDDADHRGVERVGAYYVALSSLSSSSYPLLCPLII